jgi:hypothetical protein
MIAPQRVEEVKALLADGRWSYRKIAAMTRVSRGTIGAIASGKRREPQPKPSSWNDEIEGPAGPPQRCPDCGGMVFMPCILCRTQAKVAASPLLRAMKRARSRLLGPRLRLELKPIHQARYEEVRRRKRREPAEEFATEGETP